MEAPISRSKAIPFTLLAKDTTTKTLGFLLGRFADRLEHHEKNRVLQIVQEH